MEVINFIVLIVLTFGTRAFAFYLASKIDRDAMPKNHTLAWMGKTYVALVWLIIIFGYFTTLYYNGWQFFVPGQGQFNMFASCVVTIALMLPGWAIIKFGEYLERKKQTKGMAPAR